MQLEHARGEPEPSDGFYERALLVAALLPCFLLAFDPLGLTSRQDPLPELAATALAAAASLPAALLLLARGSLPRLRGAAPLGLSALVLFYTAFFSRGTDTLEAWRDGAHAGACAVALFAGAALRARGRRLLLRGVLLVGLVQLAFALGRWAFSLDDAPGGMPDNTGLVSQAALPGAVIGAWLALSRRGRWRVLGLSTVLGFVLHASLAPVLAGGLALALSLSAAALLSPWARERRDVRALFGGLAAIALFGVLLASSPVDEPAPTADT